MNTTPWRQFCEANKLGPKAILAGGVFTNKQQAMHSVSAVSIPKLLSGIFIIIHKITNDVFPRSQLSLMTLVGII